MDIYLVITKDRHADVEVTPFKDEDAAIGHAEGEVSGNASHSEEETGPWERELNEAMTRDGWIWYCRYGIEGDSVRVIKRELRGA